MLLFADVKWWLHQFDLVEVDGEDVIFPGDDLADVKEVLKIIGDGQVLKLLAHDLGGFDEEEDEVQSSYRFHHLGEVRYIVGICLIDSVDDSVDLFTVFLIRMFSFEEILDIQDAARL